MEVTQISHVHELIEYESDQVQTSNILLYIETDEPGAWNFSNVLMYIEVTGEPPGVETCGVEFFGQVTPDGMGDPLFSDRAAWDTTKEPEYHARDIDEGTALYHLPTAGTVGQVPVWDGDKWEAGAASAASAALDDLTDVVISSPSSGQVLKYNGTVWANGADSTGEGGDGIPVNGWVAASGTWSYSSADAPTFVISVNADMTATVSAGMRIKLTQTTAKYFIVTAVGAFSGGATLITVYGGTEYTLADAAITGPYYSPVKAPLGFPLDPAKWTVTTTDTTQRSQATPTANVWYNLGGVSISVPIGAWRVSYQVAVHAAKTNSCDGFCTLSTANNSQSSAEWTAFTANATNATYFFAYREGFLTLAAKASYYLNTMTGTTVVANIYNRNELSTLVIRAVCAYL
jgi:hypothetical protein